MVSNFSETDFGFSQHEKMNKKYSYDILVSAQVNKYIFLVVYEPYRVLEGLQGVGFQGKNCFTNLVSNFSEIDFRLEIRRLVSLLAPYTA
jgi:hypothetical protein